jgi:hypothetical protein
MLPGGNRVSDRAEDLSIIYEALGRLACIAEALGKDC